ncbi:MAG: hypothetical protein ACFFC6_00075 [Promethearchaeota archaeon]
MKRIQNNKIFFLFIVLLFTYSAQGFIQFFQTESIDSHSSSLGNRQVPPLQENGLSSSSSPRTGIIPPSGSRHSPRAGVNEIVDGGFVYFPGDTIHIRNRFNIPNYDFAILSQRIDIYLFNSSDTPENVSTHFVKSDYTNGSRPAEEPSISDDPQLGWLDTTFQIPTWTELNAMGIDADDNVTIYQFYPSYNVTSEISGCPPFNRTDSFIISGYAMFSVDAPGLVNPISGDNSFRQGENATASLTAISGVDPVPDVAVDCSLYFSNDIEILNGTNGFNYYLQDSLGNPSTTTDSNGKIYLFVNTTYPTTSENDYYCNVTANFDGTGFYTSNYVPGNPSTNTETASVDFTIDNQEDIVSIDFISAIGDTSGWPKGENDSWPLNPPLENITIVTFRVQATTSYNGTSTPYILEGIPVNVTLDFGGGWPAGVTLSAVPGFSYNGSWAFTNSAGLVQFNITAIYPTYYGQKTPTIIARANLQNNSALSYPYSSVLLPHRFLTSATGVNATTSKVISIDHDFWIGEISSSLNDTSIRPGEGARLATQIYAYGDYYDDQYHQSISPIGTLPVKIELIQQIPGVSIINTNPVAPNPGYHYTDINGWIYVDISTTFGVTPEYYLNLGIKITVDFENDSNPRLIGPYHAGYDTFAEFDKTWNTIQRNLDIDANYILCNIYTRDLIENGISYPSSSTEAKILRPGDVLDVYFEVEEVIEAISLGSIPVNVSLSVSDPEVSIGFIYSDGEARPNYHKTRSDGYIAIRVTTTSSLKPQVIQLKAIADFANDSLPWHVGPKNYTQFIGNSSYSEIIFDITINPQYFTGSIYRPNPSINPNASLVVQGETFEIRFDLRLTFHNTGEILPLANALIDGISITLLVNGTTNYGLYKMRVLNETLLEASSQNTVDSTVIFYVQTNVSGSTVEDTYNISASANFGAAKGWIYNITHPSVPTGELSGDWVNGSSAADFAHIKNINIIVRNIDKITTRMGEITDGSHTDAGFNALSDHYEVYRGTSSINVTGDYLDSETKGGIYPATIVISFNYTGGTYDHPTTTSTDANGEFFVIVTIPNWFPLENITIYCWDQGNPIPREGRTGVSNVRVVSTIDLTYNLSGFTGNSVFIGESVTVSGTITDDQGNDISAYLVNSLRVSGWNGTHEFAPIVGSATGTNYNLVYLTPYDFTGDSLIIRLNITDNPQLLHYRLNSAEQLINIYHDFEIISLQIYFPSNDTLVDISNNSIYLITGIMNRDIELRGTLQDSTGRTLWGKWIHDFWNESSMLPQLVNIDGNYSLTRAFPGWENITSFSWSIYHELDNGSLLEKRYSITLQWEVYDETPPSIVIIDPVTIGSLAILSENATTILNATVFDPDSGSGVVSVGLGSVILWIDGTSYPTTQNGQNYFYNWDTASPEDKTYNITVEAFDLGNNQYSTEITVVFDIIDPTATIQYDSNNSYLMVDSSGVVSISGSLADSASASGENSGVDNSSISLIIRNDASIVHTLSSGDLNIDQDTYSYNWQIYDPITLIRDPRYTSEVAWTLILTVNDSIGNSLQIVESVNLDNVDPDLIISQEPDLTVDEDVEIAVIFTDAVDPTDLGSGVNTDTLEFELVSEDTQDVLSSYTASDTQVTLSSTSASLKLDISSEPDGDYFIRTRIADNTANIQEVSSRVFTIFHAPETSAPPQTSEPSGPNGTQPQVVFRVNLFQLILFPTLAMGGGVGVAALYERVKKMRNL